MNTLSSRYYGLLWLFLKLYGLHPDLPPRQKLIKTIFVNFNLWTLLILQMLNFVTMEYKAGTFIEVLTCLIPCSLIAISYCSIYTKQKEIWDYIHVIDQDFDELKDIKEIEIMTKYMNEWRFYMKILICSFYGLHLILYNASIFSVVFDIVVPQNKTRIRQLPILVECFIDRDEYFYEIFIVVYFLIIENGTLMIVIQATFFMNVQHARGLFDIVGHVLEHVFDHGPSNYFKNGDVENYESVVRVIKSHQKAISFVEKLNSVVEISVLINTGMMMLLICIGFIKIIYINSSSNDTKEQIASIFYTLCNFMWSYIPCFIGQQLLDQSEAIFEKVCQTPWYLTSIRTQKLSLLMIQRSTKPSYLSVGKIFVSSHRLFSDVVRMSLSYATVYYSIR